jgi:hypothetical protein
MIEVKPHAERHADRAGDPLDGLVNMFDLGIVLALAFLLAALQSANLTELLTQPDRAAALKARSGASPIKLKKDEQLKTAKPSDARVTSQSGTECGKVYKLPDGRLVYVSKKTGCP